MNDTASQLAARTSRMTIAEAAAFLRVDTATLHEAAAHGQVPSRTIAGQLVFDRLELMDELATPHPEEGRS
jgi:hypothetical protein